MLAIIAAILFAVGTLLAVIGGPIPAWLLWAGLTALALHCVWPGSPSPPWRRP